MPTEERIVATEERIVPTEKQRELTEETGQEPALPELEIDVTDDVIEKKIVLKKSGSAVHPEESEDQDSKQEARHPFKHIKQLPKIVIAPVFH